MEVEVNDFCKKGEVVSDPFHLAPGGVQASVGPWACREATADRQAEGQADGLRELTSKFSSHTRGPSLK